MVKAPRVGVDATDREINEAFYSNAPTGGNHLVVDHESFGRVGDKVAEIQTGDYVASRFAGRAGRSSTPSVAKTSPAKRSSTSAASIFVTVIWPRCSFATRNTSSKVTQNLKHLSVPPQPASVCAKATEQALLWRGSGFRFWNPRRVFVLGAGQIGPLATIDAQTARDRAPRPGRHAGTAP